MLSRHWLADILSKKSRFTLRVYFCSQASPCIYSFFKDNIFIYIVLSSLLQSRENELVSCFPVFTYYYFFFFWLLHSEENYILSIFVLFLVVVVVVFVFGVLLLVLFLFTFFFWLCALGSTLFLYVFVLSLLLLLFSLICALSTSQNQALKNRL